jgi:gamma-glutamylputrescine oxidase
MQPTRDLLASDSYYTQSAPPAPPWPALAGDVDCDVAIVGGGFAGLSAAIELADRGLRVCLLEAKTIGWGASGRNGGQALPGLACDIGVVARQLGAADARRIFDLTAAALQLIRDRCARFAIDCDWQAGALTVAVGARRARALRAWHDELARDYGYAAMRWIGADAVRGWVDSPRYDAAVFDPGAGHLHPLKYAHGLARAAAGLGVRLHEHSQVTALERGARLRLTTAAGTVRCAQALLAGNVYLDRLAPSIATRIMPVGTYIAATAPLSAAQAQRLIPSRAAVSDTQFVLDYFRLSADERLLFGGRVSYSGVTPPRLGAAMRRRIAAVFPPLAGVAIESCWGGYVDITLNRAPDFGRLAPNLYYLQGFSGHGVGLTAIAGLVAAEAMAGQRERFDLFARLRHRDFPGGPALRVPALVLAMLWYRLRDLIG